MLLPQAIHSCTTKSGDASSCCVISANLFEMAFNFGSGFGVPQQPAFSQFQQSAPASTFGVQSFGAQPNAPAFGAQGLGGAQGFATSAPNQFSAAGAGFGTGFGAQPNAPAFGAPGMGSAQGFVTPATGQFGAQGTSGFGQATTTLPQGSAFGAAAQQGGFGATAYAAFQGGFAPAAAAIGCGNQGSGFGAAPAPNAFRASSFNVAPASGGFGATAFGAAAAPASFNAGGTVGFQSQTYCAQLGFSKSAGDEGDGNVIVNSNCAKMTDQSNESQLLKDYSTGNKGGQQGFGMAGAGGATAPFPQQAPYFLPATTGFQTGQQQTMPTPFGQQQQQQQQQAQPAFGSPFGVAAGNKVTTPATASNLFGGQDGAAATPFATNVFMPQATGAANPFGGIPTTAASSASLFPGAANPPFGAAPASSGTLFAPAPFGFNNPPASNAGLQNLQPSGQFNTPFPQHAPSFPPATTSAAGAPNSPHQPSTWAAASTAAFCSAFGAAGGVQQTSAFGSAAQPPPMAPPAFVSPTAVAGSVGFAGSAAEVHPDLPAQLLQRIRNSDPALTKLEIMSKSNFKEAGCRVLARVLSLNTCITRLDLFNTGVGAGGACVLFPALTHLTAMTFLNLALTHLGSSGALHLCSALPHLSAMTELDLGYNELSADDGARICGAAAAAGMTRLKTLDLDNNGFTPSQVVECEAWRQLNLPQPPDEIVRKCKGVFHFNCAPLVSYLLS
jgi:hypothetical protein